MVDTPILVDQVKVIIAISKKIDEIKDDIRKKRVEFRRDNADLYDELDQAKSDLEHELSILDGIVKEK